MENPKFLLFDESLVGALRQAVVSTLKDVFQIHAQSDAYSVGRKTSLILDPMEACSISIEQENILCGAFIAAFSREILLKVLKQYAACETEDPKMLEDAAGEIANMIYGSFKTEMNKRGYRLTMGLPIAFYADKESADKYRESEKMILPFIADGHQCKIIIAQSH